MSSRRKRRAAAQQRAEEILRSKVRLDGIGEDPAVRAFLTKMPTAKQAEAMELALALDRYLMGDQSVLENPKYADHINKMRARASEIEDAERRWSEDPVKFYDEVWSDAEKRIATGDKKAQMEARASKMYQDARTTSVATRESKKLQLDWMIANGPKEDVQCPGVVETIMVNGTPTPRLLPIRVRIMHQYYDLKPGHNLGVPSVFAARYRQVKQAMDDEAAREAALVAGMRSRDLEIEQDRISVQLGTGRDRQYQSQILAVDNAR